MASEQDHGHGRSRKAFLLATVALGLGGFALTLGALLWFDMHYRTLLVRSEEQLVRALAEDASLLSGPPLISRDLDGLVFSLRMLLERTQISDVMVIDSDDHIVAHLARSGPGGSIAESLDGTTSTPPTVARMDRTAEGDLVRWLPVPGAGSLGWVRVEVPPIATRGSLDAIRDQTVVAAVFGGLALLLLTVLSMTGAYRVVERRESGLVAECDELHHAVQHDRLTGLFNRSGLLERLERALASRRAEDHRLALCFLDLDGFKAVNDRYGHEMGDLLLVEVARRLSACVRRTDMVARLGGDEFVLLLEGESRPGELLAIIERVIARVSQRVPAAGKPLRVGVSIGVAVRQPGDDSADLMLKYADEAMYEAKRGGRNRWVLHRSASGLLFSSA